MTSSVISGVKGHHHDGQYTDLASDTDNGALVVTVNGEVLEQRVSHRLHSNHRNSDNQVHGLLRAG